MGTVFSVQADTREECERELARLCAALGLERALAPSRSIGTERWMARAAQKVPAEGRDRRGGGEYLH
ncbi:hypothetical protein [Streptomyces sp. NPDC015131]|uniref:hypothetical protein n=1 Tax=Streptomyces sp. NPDC015131 TaxID=3364941 RepID=UPI0036FD1C70